MVASCFPKDTQALARHGTAAEPDHSACPMQLNRDEETTEVNLTYGQLTRYRKDRPDI